MNPTDEQVKLVDRLMDASRHPNRADAVLEMHSLLAVHDAEIEERVRREMQSLIEAIEELFQIEAHVDRRHEHISFFYDEFIRPFEKLKRLVRALAKREEVKS